MIVLARATAPRLGPVPDTLPPNAAEDSLEIGVGNQESVVLRLDRSIGCRESERHSIAELHRRRGLSYSAGPPAHRR